MIRRSGWHRFIVPLAASIIISCQLSPSRAWTSAAASRTGRHFLPTTKSKPPPCGYHNSDRIHRHELHMSTKESEPEQQQSRLTLEKASSLLSTFWSMAYPYYRESQAGRRLFFGMVVLTLINSGVSVAFSYISKDFWNALSSKDTTEFYNMMIKFGGALVVGAPVAVLYRCVCFWFKSSAGAKILFGESLTFLFLCNLIQCSYYLKVPEGTTGCRLERMDD